MKQSLCETILIRRIRAKVKRSNMDNISRTKFYESFFRKHPEIIWSLLAGIVSRNAGWHMCDLEGPVLTPILPLEYRRLLFFMLERANWLIFQDACPQLLIYHYSTLWKTPLFHLLPYFSVSRFMQEEWQRFWQERDEERLCYALIINEQNLIQVPVIEQPVFEKKVFQSFAYRIQEFFACSYVLLPSTHGALYGFPVKNFTMVGKRIELGKQLAAVLFAPHLHDDLYRFVKIVEPTGSRRDYEQFLTSRTGNNSRPLRLIYPVIDHSPSPEPSWDHAVSISEKWFQRPSLPVIQPVTDRILTKQKEIACLARIHGWFRS